MKLLSLIFNGGEIFKWYGIPCYKIICYICLQHVQILGRAIPELFRACQLAVQKIETFLSDAKMFIDILHTIDLISYISMQKTTVEQIFLHEFYMSHFCVPPCMLSKLSVFQATIFASLGGTAQTSKNFKVRISACTGLAAAKLRSLYGSTDTYLAVWQSLANVLESLEDIDTNYVEYKYHDSLVEQVKHWCTWCANNTLNV